MSVDYHGTSGGYTNHACRCADCTAAATQAHRRQNEKRKARLDAGTASVRHGSADTYKNWGCRCAPCRDANAAHSRLVRARRKAAKS